MNLFIRRFTMRIIAFSGMIFSIISLTILSLTHAAPININSADIPTIIDNLADIGPAKATAIIEYRELNGPFKRAEDLLLVKGIGEKTLEKNRANLLFEDVTTPEPQQQQQQDSPEQK